MSTPEIVANIAFGLIVSVFILSIFQLIKRSLKSSQETVTSKQSDLTKAIILNDRGQTIHTFVYDSCKISSDNTTEFSLNDDVVCWVPNSYIVVVKTVEII